MGSATVTHWNPLLLDILSKMNFGVFDGLKDSCLFVSIRV